MKATSWRRFLVVLAATLPFAAITVGNSGQSPAAPPGDPIPYETNGPKPGSRLWGYADASGRLIIPARFDKASRFGPDGLAEIERDGKWGMVDRSGVEVVPARNSFQVPMVDGLAGICVDTGEAVPGVSVIGPKPGERTAVTRGKCGYVDRQGKVAIPIAYDWVRPFSEGVAQVMVSRLSDHCPATDFGRATLWGLVNTKGQLVLPIDYCFVGPSDHGWIRVVYESHGPSDARVGFVDREGRVVLAKLPYDFTGERWTDDLLPVRYGNRWGVIDRKGHEVLPVRYGAVSITGGLVRASLDGKWGFFDTSGKVVVPHQYEEASDFSEGLACVKTGGRHGFIDRTGKLVVAAGLDLGQTCAFGKFNEGLRPAPQGGKWGFLDHAGTFVIAPQFDEAWGFSEGVAAVRTGSLWGFVDRAGTFAIPPKYFRVDAGFTDGFAYVTTRVISRQNIYSFARGYVNHQGREFFDAPGQY